PGSSSDTHLGPGHLLHKRSDRPTAGSRLPISPGHVSPAPIYLPAPSISRPHLSPGTAFPAGSHLPTQLVPLAQLAPFRSTGVVSINWGRFDQLGFRLVR